MSLKAAEGRMKRLLMPLAEGAQMLGVCKDTVYALLEQKRLRSVRLGRRHMLTVESVEAIAKPAASAAA